MTTVHITDTESTKMGDMAELIIDKSIEPAVGMILMDEDSQTWEVTGALKDTNRIAADKAQRWTCRCTPVNTEKSIHTGTFKLIH